MNTTRSRWAAIGAAVAVTLGAGGIGIANATTDSSEGPVSAFFPIEPCRLIANASITEDSSITLNGWGTTGDCELPDDITGLAANVTAVNATQQTNIRFYAQGGDVPETANLNPTPGAAATPNAVNITLNDTNGQFQVYNRFGSVGIFVDVMGYYDDHTHDDRYTTFAVGTDTGATAAQVLLTDTFQSVMSVAVTAPIDGQVVVTSTANVFHDTANGDVGCFILRSTDADPLFGTNILGAQWFESEGAIANDGSIAGSRLFDVAAESTTTFELRCREGIDDGGRFFGGTMTATFTPAPRS